MWLISYNSLAFMSTLWQEKGLWKTLGEWRRIQADIWRFVWQYNLGQKVGDELTKLSKIGSSMECFTAYFYNFFTKK